jgi:hypothetical protein
MEGIGTMTKRVNLAWLGLAMMAATAAAQTGTVPLDAGTPPTGMTNSNITVSNGNVGIGTTSPGGILGIGNASIPKNHHGSGRYNSHIEF